MRAAAAAGHNRAVIHHHRRPLPIVLAVAALALVAARAAVAAERPSVDSVLETLGRVVNLRETAISPDGSRVAWAQKLRGADGTETRSSLHVSAVDGSGARVLTAARDGKPHRERDVAWSPDGRAIAFLSDAAQEGQLQLYVAPAAGGPPRVITRAHGQLEHPRWSPDGKRIAVLYVAGSAQEQGALVAYKPHAGVVEETVEAQRIAVVDAAGGELREVSPADLYVYDYDWSPDGRRFAAEAVHGSGTNNYWTAELYVVDAGGGETRSLWKPPLQIALPRWSPDGASIAVIHGLMSDEGSNGGDVMLVPAAGGPPRNLTPGFAGSASGLAWRPAGDVLFTAHADGETMIGTVSPSARGVTTAWRGPALLTYFSLAPRWPRLLRRPRIVRGSAGGVGGRGRRRTGGHAAQCGDQAAVGRGEEPPLGQRRPPRAGMAHLSAARRSGRAPSPRRQRARRTLLRVLSALAVALDGRPPDPGLLRLPAEPPRQLRPGGGLHPGQREGLRLRRPARHPEGRGRRRRRRPHRLRACRHGRVELRRIHVDVDGHPDGPLQGGGGGSGNRELAELLRAEPHRPVDAALLRRLRVRRSRRLREVFTHHVHQERQDADPGPARRPRFRSPDSAGLRVLARPEDARSARRSSSSTRTRDMRSRSPRTSSTSRSGRWSGSIVT